MYYKQFSLPGLEDIVSHLWEIKLKKDELMDGYCLMPDNHGEVMINLGQPLRKRIAGHFREHTFEFGEVHWYNCRSKGMIFTSAHDIHLLSAKIKPGCFSALMPANPEHIRDHAYQTNTSFDPRRLDAISQLTHAVKSRIRTGIWNPDRVVMEGILLICERKGNIRISEICDEIAVSKSSLEQKFMRELSISPKEFCKIEKLKGFMINYDQYHPDYNLTQLTFQSGYYDQSHFIKDFRYFMDMPPRTYFQNTARVI